MATTHLLDHQAPPAVAARKTWSPWTSFWVVVVTATLLPAASNFPTPLFPLWAKQYGFSSGMVTLLFGAYVVALIPSLLTLGRLTDRIGRRPVLIIGTGISAVSSLAFVFASGVAWLFAGELIYGVAAGMVVSCSAVAIRELHPKQNLASGALAATLAFAAGLALGPFVSGLLATVTPWPTVAPFVLDIVLAVVLVAALLRIPETKPDVPAPARRAPVLHVPHGIRPAFIAATLAAASGWMLTGWVLGLSPSFLHAELGVQISQPVVSGLFAALVLVANGVSQVAFRRFNSQGHLRTGLAVAVAGMALIAGSPHAGGLPVALVGAVVAGLGVGVVQMNTMATVMRISPVHARGGVTAAFFTLCYVAMSVPVVIAGLSADSLGLGVVTAWFLVALAVLVGAAVVASYRPAVVTEIAATPAVDMETVDIVEAGAPVVIGGRP